MRGLVEVFASATRWMHYASGALIVGLMLLTVANILGRWTMGRPVSGTVEITELAMVAIVFLGLAYAQVREDHIRVDLVYERMGPQGKTILGVFAAAVSFLTVVLLTWRIYDYTGVLRASGRTTSALAIPIFWVAWVAVAGSAVYAIGTIVTGVRRAEGPPSLGPPDAGLPPAEDVPPSDER